jgi:Putative prokaryotic signal transducing protein
MSQHSNWVKIHEDFDFFRAELLKNYLIEEHGIDAVIVNKQLSGYNFGKCEIHVLNENSEKARQLIKDFDQNNAK